MGSEDQLSLNPPWLVNFNFTSNTITPAATFTSGFSSNTLDPASVNLSQVQLRAANPNASTSYIQQYSIGIQRELAGDWLAEIAYVGTRGTHLFTLRDLNQPLPGQTSLPRDQRFPFPAFGLVEYRDDNGISNYNSMEATLDKRFHGGYTVRAVYTFSKSLDNSFEHLTSGGSNSFPQNAHDTLLTAGLRAHQKFSRSANCITRGSPARVVMVPTFEMLMVRFGRPKLARFRALKTSQRNSASSGAKRLMFPVTDWNLRQRDQKDLMSQVLQSIPASMPIR
jgi:hypothetical protein